MRLFLDVHAEGQDDLCTRLLAVKRARARGGRLVLRYVPMVPAGPPRTMPVAPSVRACAGPLPLASGRLRAVVAGRPPHGHLRAGQVPGR